MENGDSAETYPEMSLDRAIVLVRTPVNDERSVESCKMQEASCREWCKEKGIEVVQVFVERPVNGRAKAYERRILLQAIWSMKTSGAAVLLVKSMDRFSRDIVELQKIARMVKAEGGVAISTVSGFTGFDFDDLEKYLPR